MPLFGVRTTWISGAPNKVAATRDKQRTFMRGGLAALPILPTSAASRIPIIARDRDQPILRRRFDNEHSSWFHFQRSEYARSFRRSGDMVCHIGRVRPCPHETRLRFPGTRRVLRLAIVLSKA